MDKQQEFSDRFYHKHFVREEEPKLDIQGICTKYDTCEERYVGEGGICHTSAFMYCPYYKQTNKQ